MKIQNRMLRCDTARSLLVFITKFTFFFFREKLGIIKEDRIWKGEGLRFSFFLAMSELSDFQNLASRRLRFFTLKSVDDHSWLFLSQGR
jgi:hypothetical protein